MVVVPFFAGGGDTYCTRYFEITSVTDVDDCDEVLAQLIEGHTGGVRGELLLTAVCEIALEL